MLPSVLRRGARRPRSSAAKSGASTGTSSNPEPGSSLLVAEAGERLLGFVYLQRVQDYFTLEHHGHVGILAVTEEAEGQGAGTALLRAAEAWARERGYRKLTLSVFEDNHRARGMYDRAGFRPDTIKYLKVL